VRDRFSPAFGITLVLHAVMYFPVVVAGPVLPLASEPAAPRAEPGLERCAGSREGGTFAGMGAATSDRR
jgi:hypothetical protein